MWKAIDSVVESALSAVALQRGQPAPILPPIDQLPEKQAKARYQPPVGPHWPIGRALEDAMPKLWGSAEANAQKASPTQELSVEGSMVHILGRAAEMSSQARAIQKQRRTIYIIGVALIIASSPLAIPLSEILLPTAVAAIILFSWLGIATGAIVMSNRKSRDDFDQQRLVTVTQALYALAPSMRADHPVKAWLSFSGYHRGVWKKLAQWEHLGVLHWCSLRIPLADGSWLLVDVRTSIHWQQVRVDYQTHIDVRLRPPAGRHLRAQQLTFANVNVIPFFYVANASVASNEAAYRFVSYPKARSFTGPGDNPRTAAVAPADLLVKSQLVAAIVFCYRMTARTQPAGDFTSNGVEANRSAPCQDSSGVLFSRTCADAATFHCGLCGRGKCEHHIRSHAGNHACVTCLRLLLGRDAQQRQALLHLRDDPYFYWYFVDDVLGTPHTPDEHPLFQ